MNQAILNTQVQEFIKNFKGSITKLALSGSPFPNVSSLELIQQIESRNAIEKKLPTWFTAQHIYYPPKLNLEQTSSEMTAKYKASLVHGTTIADLTAGFGVDGYYFSKNFTEVSCFEINGKLSEISRHNFKTLQIENVSCFAENGLEGIQGNFFDVIYIDPSRRHDSKGRVFYLKDCEPNVTENIPFLFKHCKTILLKTSPMLDITQGFKELSNVSEVHIVAVGNDVKEVLWILEEDADESPQIMTLNFSIHGVETFNFEWNEIGSAQYSSPKQFLYSPNGALMKSGAYALISEKFGLYKLHTNTHLYTSDTLKDFPGRRFRIDRVVPYSKKDMKHLVQYDKANVATRNFPESVAVIRKKWRIKEGGDTYLFFVTIENDQKVVLVCSKE
jgi:hypothetical protein